MTEFLGVAGAHFLALLSPGPDFFIIISASVANGARRSILTCLGIAIANGVYIFMAVFGFSLIQQNVWVLGVMKAAGGVFLCYLGLMLLRSGRRELYSDDKTAKADISLRLFTSGFLSALLNPKNPIFYMSLYTIFISPETSVFVQSAYGIWMFSAVLFWDIFVAYSVGNTRVRAVLNRYTHRIEQVSGAVIILLGVLIGCR